MKALLWLLIWMSMAAGSWTSDSYVDLSLYYMGGFTLAIVPSVIAAIRRRTARHVLVRAVLAAVVGAVAPAFAGGDSRTGGNAAYLITVAPSLLVWPWAAKEDPVPAPGSVAAHAKRDRRRWGLPFALAASQTFGALVGFGVAAGSAIGRDPAGSAGALLALGTVFYTVILSTATVGFFTLLRKATPDRMALRVALGVGTGGLVGGLSWAFQRGDMSLVPLVILGLATIVLSSPWPGRSSAPKELPPA